MMQAIDAPVSVTTMSSAPTLAGDGVDLTGGASGQADYRFEKWTITVALSGGTSLELYIYALVNGTWCILTDSGNAGLLGGQALASGKTYVETLDNLGIATRFAIVKGAEVGGTVTPTVSIARVRERR